MGKISKLLSLIIVFGLMFFSTNTIEAKEAKANDTEQHVVTYTQEDYNLIKQKQIEMGVTPEKAEELVHHQKLYLHLS